MGSICESSTWFAGGAGTAAAQLDRMLDVAQLLGSKIVRCYQGSSEDRPGSAIGEALAPRSRHRFTDHIANTIATLRSVRGHALDLGVRIAIENHAGGLHSQQLRAIIEEAGPDFVGAVFDAGNAMWTLETPMMALETLSPYVLTSHIRDSAVWEVPEGVAVQWCPLGLGSAGIPTLVTRFAQLCPGRAFSLEIINVAEPRLFRYHDPAFWDGYRDIPAWSFAGWLEVARIGRRYASQPVLTAPAAAESDYAKDRIESDAALVERERQDVEDALRYAKEVLGLGGG
jgi:sugar phosphate isomerase/epimerase